MMDFFDDFVGNVAKNNITPRSEDHFMGDLKFFLFRTAWACNKKITCKNVTGNTVTLKDIGYIEEVFKANPPVVVLPYYDIPYVHEGKKVHYGTWFFLWDNSFARVECGTDGTISSFTAFSLDGQNHELFDNILSTFFVEKEEGEISVVIPTRGGLTTSTLGIAGVPFRPINYRPEVVTAFKEIVEDLHSQDPLGRLIIIDGPPGTGKTYLVRSLLSECGNCKFIILPSNAASELGGPDMLQLLMNEAQSASSSDDKKEGHPLVLIIEDADSCLSQRAADNISAISSILNLTDGIIGNLLDLRIVCTTNVEIEQIDEALLRKGRLSARIEVGKLDAEQAKKVYEETGGKGDVEFTEKFYSLGDIYALTKEKKKEKEVEKKETRKVGFQPQ